MDLKDSALIPEADQNIGRRSFVNAVAWFQLLNLLSTVPQDSASLTAQRRIAFECIERSECMSIFKDGDYVVYRKEDLIKNCKLEQNVNEPICKSYQASEDKIKLLKKTNEEKKGN